MGVGKRIKDIATEQKVSLREVAERAGLSYNSLYSIVKRDSSRIQLSVLVRIARALNVPISDLVLVEDYEETDRRKEDASAVDVISKASKATAVTDNDAEKIKLLIYNYLQLTDGQQRAVMQIMESINFAGTDIPEDELRAIEMLKDKEKEVSP